MAELEIVRTPDPRFAQLPDFPWLPHYADDLDGYAGVRVAWIDEGPRDAAHTYLCLHGQPTPLSSSSSSECSRAPR